MIIIKSLNGDLFSIDYNKESPPTVSFIREHLRQLIEHPRNEYVHLFYNDDELKDEDEVKDETDLLMLVDFEKKMKVSEKLKVESGLVKYIGENNFQILRNIVKESSALIAGGSILCSFHDGQINDLDIYVNYSKCMLLIESMKSIGFAFLSYKWNQAPAYDSSFFRKNKILTRFHMIMKSQFRLPMNRRQSIDIMVIPDHYPLENVVTNFDLSFCEIWWDGDHVYANDPYGVRNKEGILKPDYRHSFFTEMNSFIFKRINKYRKRGFMIDLGKRDEFIIHPSVAKNKVISSEDWSICFFLKQLCSISLIPNRYKSIHKIYFTFFPQEMTYNALVEKWGDETMIKKLSAYFYETLKTFLPENYLEFYKETFVGCNLLNNVYISLSEIQQDIEKMLKRY